MNTFTYTATATFARIELMKMQIRIALRRATNLQGSSLDAIGLAIEKRWINKVVVYGINGYGLCRSQLVLSVDWNEYDRQMSKGRITVSIDERWIDNTAIEIDEAVNLFNRFVVENTLRTEVQHFHPPGVDIDMVCRELGWSRAKPIQWDGIRQQAWSNQIPELSELRVGCFLAD